MKRIEDKFNEWIELDCFLKDSLWVAMGDMFIEIEDVDSRYINDDVGEIENPNIKVIADQQIFC